MFIRNGEIYLKKHHVQLLKKEPEYVKKRYHAVAVALYSKNNIIREKAAQNLRISMRQFQRLLHRFQVLILGSLHIKWDHASTFHRELITFYSVEYEYYFA